MRVSFSAVLFAAASVAGLTACHAQAPAPQAPASQTSTPQSSAAPPQAGIFGDVIEAPRIVAGPRVPLTIRTAKGAREFRVEVARTSAQQEQGLMFRRELEPNTGMIFPMNSPRSAAFWMRNTIIPLDMVFIRRDGTIARIAANTVPFSEATVESGEPVAAVLEIAGGRAAELGIVAGDKVSWEADHPCGRREGCTHPRIPAKRLSMGLLKSIFTWWDGATIGTSLFSRRNGAEVGRDSLGNIYFETKKADKGVRRRWVIYNGSNDASRVPPEWHSWLHNTIDAVPDRGLPPARAWEQAPISNATGTPAAYRPAGSLERGGQRSAATGDYEAWSPDTL